MKGLELSKKYYEEFGKPMLEQNFSDILPYLAIGFVGSGSDRYGFDDEISRDHDFEPGFCIFLPDESAVTSQQEFKLRRAYSKLPNEFCGIKRNRLSPVGGDRNGVIRTSEFYLSAVGSESGDLSVEAWLNIPDYALAEAVNGEIYYDGYGEFTKIREKIKNMPRDIKLKRLAGNLLIMAQSGQYNFNRCINHGEAEAAQLACTRFVESTMKVLFLLENRYLPYYKWSFRALCNLDGGKEIAELLSSIIFGDSRNINIAQEKYTAIEKAAALVIDKLNEQNLTDAVCGDLEKHAYSVNDKIKDGNIRNMHILETINE